MVGASSNVTSGQAQAASAQLPQGILGKDDFLRLLITQLRYQDPLNPMEGTEFAAQLAQFSSVEQLANINSNLQASLDGSYLMTQAISNSLATTMIGKEVKAGTDRVTFDGKSDVSLGYTLSGPAASVSIKIYDESGTLVRTIAAGGGGSGDHSVEWDGANDAGAALPTGTYRFEVAATNPKGAAVPATPYVTGAITGVRFRADGTYFVVNGQEVPLAEIVEISRGGGDG
jgi:flagellar basal-body rod modification protein FlgD